MASNLFPKGSVGGCYTIPLSPLHNRCKQLSLIQTISLTPPGFLTNQILKFFILDIIGVTIEELEDTDSEGNCVCVPLDVSALLGDYPASLQANDVMKNSAGAPFQRCTFCHQNKHGLPDYSHN